VWPPGILLRDLRDRDVDAPAKEIPAAAPSKLTRKKSIIVSFLFAVVRRIGALSRYVGLPKKNFRRSRLRLEC